MAILLTLSIVPVILKLVLGDVDEDKRKKITFYSICGLAIFLVMGLRDRNTGSPDTNFYAALLDNFDSKISLGEYFRRINSDETFFLFAEYGFYFLVWILGKLALGPQSLLITTSFIICLCTMIFLYRHSEDSFLSILMFICLGSFTFAMNGMRQAVAMSICLLSYVFVERRKFIPFLLTILVATMFHKTAIFFIVVYLISLVNAKPRDLIIFSIVLVAFYFLSDSLVEIFDEVTNKDYADAESIDGGGVITVLLYLASLILLITENREFKENNIAIILTVVLGLYLYVFRYFSILIFERMSYYFYYFILLLIPREIKALDNVEKKIIYLLFALFCVALFAYRIPGGAFANFKFFSR